MKWTPLHLGKQIYVCLSFYLSIYLSVYLSVRLSLEHSPFPHPGSRGAKRFSLAGVRDELDPTAFR